MSRSNRFTAAAVLVGLLGVSALAQSAAAQASATANAYATITGGLAPLTAVKNADLQFGTVTANTTKTVTLDADAARWTLGGEPSHSANVSFLLPTTLLGPGGATIPISFGVNDGLEWAAYPGPKTTFNPNSAYSTAFDAFGSLIIGLFGTVAPPLTAINGAYTGSITLTVSYF